MTTWWRNMIFVCWNMRVISIVNLVLFMMRLCLHHSHVTQCSDTCGWCVFLVYVTVAYARSVCASSICLVHLSNVCAWCVSGACARCMFLVHVPSIQSQNGNSKNRRLLASEIRNRCVYFKKETS